MKKNIILVLTVFLIIPFVIVTANATDSDAVCQGRYLGDANADGTVSADDARFILRYSVGLEKCSSDEQLLYLNVYSDNDINAADARLALRISVALDKGIKHDYENVSVKESTCSQKGYTASVCKYCKEKNRIDSDLLSHTPLGDSCTGFSNCIKCNAKVKVNVSHRFSLYKCSDCGAADYNGIKRDATDIVKSKGSLINGRYIYRESQGFEVFYMLYSPETDEVTVGIELFVDNNSESTYCYSEVSFLSDSDAPEIFTQTRSNNEVNASAVYIVDKNKLSPDNKAYDSLIQKKYSGETAIFSDVRRLAYDCAVSSLLWFEEIMNYYKYPVDLTDLGFTVL